MALIVGLFFVGGLIGYWNLFDEIQGNSEFLPITGFFIIWSVGCGGLFVHFIKLYILMKTGKIEVGEIDNLSKDFKSNIEVEKVSNSIEESKNDFETRLRSIDSLKKDGLINEEEYKNKRTVIMQDKW